MIKKIFILLFSIFLFSCASTKFDTNDIQEEVVIHDVDTGKEIKRLNVEFYWSAHYVYDKKGNKILCYSPYFENGKIPEWISEYDKNNNKILEIFKQGTAGEKITKKKFNDKNILIYSKDEHVEQWYDNSGNLLHEIDYEHDCESFYEYNEKGKPTLEWNSDGERTVYEYDSAGNLIHEKYTFETGFWDEYYEYDKNNNEVRHVWYSKDEDEEDETERYFIEEEISDYNENNQLVFSKSETRYFLDEDFTQFSHSSISEYSCNYNDNGNMIEYKWCNDGEIMQHVFYKYDDKERIVHKNIYSNMGKKHETTREYTYDENGTCTEKVNGKIVLVETADGQTLYNSETGLQTWFDAKGNLIHRIKSYNDSGKETVYDTEYFYDENNRKIKEIERKNGEKFTTITEYEYDNHGNLVYEDISKSNHGRYQVEFYINKYTYYKNGKIKTHTIYHTTKFGV